MTQVQKELKNESTYESLQWQTDEGIVTEPYYTAAELSDLPLDTIQKAQKTVPGWLNAPEYQVTDEKSTNVQIKEARSQGADAIVLDLPAANTNVAQLLNGIKLSETPVFFRAAASTGDPVTFIKTLQNIAPYQLKGGLLMDSTDAIAEITRLTADSPQFRTVCTTSHVFHNAGATAAQELAFTMAALADTYNDLIERGLSPEQLIQKTILSVSVGTSYFLEIAKLRALRVLLNRFLSAYDPDLPPAPCPVLVHCQTSTFYDAAVTPYTNLLRATTEAMAAVIGGCDVLTVHPYNTILNTTVESGDHVFAERIARNVSILLKDESHLDKVADPAAGSYYVENLTHQLTEAAWLLFTKVKEDGGYRKVLLSGFIQHEIEQSYQARLEAIRTGKVLVGVTKFRSDETTAEKKTLSPENSLFPRHRLAENFE